MNYVIWKYELTAGRQELMMPLNALLLTVQSQGGKPQLWALVEETEDRQMKTIGVFGTGLTIELSDDETMRYINTFQIPEWGFVFHCFEIL